MRLALFPTMTAVVLLAMASAHAATQVVPGQVTLVPLDQGVVATGGTAVTALASGKHGAGGWIANPANAAGPLCVNEQGTATGTTSNGSTVCLNPGDRLTLSNSNTPVSVTAADSGHVFAGAGATE